MAKKVLGYIKLQLPAGKATPQPPVGPAVARAVAQAARDTGVARI